MVYIGILRSIDEKGASIETDRPSFIQKDIKSICAISGFKK